MSLLNKSSRNRIIIVLLFSIICIGATLFFIFGYGKINIVKNENNNDSNVSQNINTTNTTNNSITDKDVKGLESLNETYKGNALKVENVFFNDGNVGFSSKYRENQVEANYVQIAGLKNSEIQNKINKCLKDDVYNSYNKNELNNNTTISIKSACTANFANVLSVYTEIYQYDSKNDLNCKTEYICRNFDLNTGNEIRFDDIFVPNATIKSILSKCVYDSLVTGGGAYTKRDGIFFTEDVQEKFSYNDLTERFTYIEEKLFKINTIYKNGGKINFWFSPRTVKIFYDNEIITIPMIDYYSQIAIYNRFNNNQDLYDGSYEDYIKNDAIPVFVSTNNVGVEPDPRPEMGSYLVYQNSKKESDSLFINIFYDGSPDSRNDFWNLHSEVRNKVSEIINKEKNKNDGKVRYVEIRIGDEWGDEGKRDINVGVGSVDKRYGQEFIEIIIQSLQKGNSTIYIPVFENNNVNVDLSDTIWKDKKELFNNIKYSSYYYEWNGKSWKQETYYLDGVHVENQNYISNIEKEENDTNKNITNKVIVIDPGHQAKGNSSQEPIGPGATQTKAKVSGGATGVSTGQTEYELNLKVSLKLQEKLQQKGYTVIMTRSSNNVDISNKERAEIANKENAAAFIRIHANSATSNDAKGVLTMCQSAENKYNGNLANDSYRLSKLVLDSVVKSTGANNRGVIKTDDMTGINWCNVPSTLIEMGFLSNSEEDTLLASEEYQDKIVKGIVEGIENFLK